MLSLPCLFRQHRHEMAISMTAHFQIRFSLAYDFGHHLFGRSQWNHHNTAYFELRQQIHRHRSRSAGDQNTVKRGELRQPLVTIPVKTPDPASESGQQCLGFQIQALLPFYRIHLCLKLIQDISLIP